MQVEHLKLHDFRNIETAALRLHPKRNVLAGDNAQGKTNFLEAMHLLLCQRSFRGAKSEEMIRFGRDVARLTTTVNHNDVEREIKLTISEKSRIWTLDDKRVRSTSNWPPGMTAVIFTPDDLSTPKGTSSARRKLLDGAVTSLWAGYAELMRNYTKTVTSRNRLLKDRPTGFNELLEVYDHQISSIGAKVVATRMRFISTIEADFCAAFSHINDNAVASSIRYAPTITNIEKDLSVEQIAERLVAATRASRREDMARRTTSVGPHRDDVDFIIGDKDARRFGSQGQVRALVLAFRMAQIKAAQERFGSHPVLLLDDVSSELDEKKNKKLFDFIDETACQLVVTTARPELLPSSEKFLLLRVVKGHITPE